MKQQPNDGNHSLDPTVSCGSSQYHVMKNFSSFLAAGVYQSDPKWKKEVDLLYKMRSQILHRGYLLLSDLRAPGHYSYKESKEVAQMRSLVTLVKVRLINWLLENNTNR